jgi:RimJ/RimL family protein N-acetyltransferase
MADYLFTSERLGFRNWTAKDVDCLFKINTNKKVMRFFPSVLTKQETEKFIERMQQQYAEKGFCYFAVNLLKTSEFIGFIGLSEQKFKSTYTPAIDIGWRLDSKFWHKGYATEGAKRCLAFGFNNLNLKEIIAIAPKINFPSVKVMQKIGMVKIQDFKHPLLGDFSDLETCVLYTSKSTIDYKNK